jgi:type I restriction enzyme S subunit
VREDFWPHNAALFVRNFKGNDVRFVAYLLESLDFSSLNSGSAQQSLNRNYVYGVQVPERALPEQRRIADILSAYDDLIENCERRIRVLDEMARALYREWFVLFRYPGHDKVPLVESTAGRLPAGWSLRSVKEVSSVLYGYPLKSEGFATEPVGFPVVRIRDIPNGQSATYTTEAVADRYMIQDGDLLVGMDGDFHMTVWWSGPAIQNQRVARFTPGPAMAVLPFFYSLEEKIRELNAAIVGTTVAHLGDMHIKQIKLVVPDHDFLDRVRAAFNPIGEEVGKLKKMARTLRQTRDLLLPRLLSGRLRVTPAA